MIYQQTFCQGCRGRRSLIWFDKITELWDAVSDFGAAILNVFYRQQISQQLAKIVWRLLRLFEALKKREHQTFPWSVMFITSEASSRLCGSARRMSDQSFVNVMMKPFANSQRMQSMTRSAHEQSKKEKEKVISHRFPHDQRQTTIVISSYLTEVIFREPEGTNKKRKMKE